MPVPHEDEPAAAARRGVSKQSVAEEDTEGRWEGDWEGAGWEGDFWDMDWEGDWEGGS